MEGAQVDDTPCKGKVHHYYVTKAHDIYYDEESKSLICCDEQPCPFRGTTREHVDPKFQPCNTFNHFEHGRKGPLYECEEGDLHITHTGQDIHLSHYLPSQTVPFFAPCVEQPCSFRHQSYTGEIPPEYQDRPTDRADKGKAPEQPTEGPSGNKGTKELRASLIREDPPIPPPLKPEAWNPGEDMSDIDDFEFFIR